MGKILSLGESLMRLSSQKGNRLSNATELFLHYGGAEANVATNLSMWNHDVKYATKLPAENDLSRNIILQLKGYGVDCQNIIYGEGRLGSYYLEVGTGLRATNVIYDRKYSAISLMDDIEWDLDQLFNDVDLFIITGITLALSPSWRQIGVKLIQEAKKRDIKVNFDMNFRQKLWSSQEAKETYAQLLPYVDYLSAGKLDAIHFMDVPEVEEEDEMSYYMQAIADKYPNLQYIYGTERRVKTPNTFDMNGFIWDCQSQAISKSVRYQIDSVVDRVGTGDTYAAGIIDGIVREDDLHKTVEFAMAATTLKHTVFGDVNLFTRQEIEEFMVNKSNIKR